MITIVDEHVTKMNGILRDYVSTKTVLDVETKVSSLPYLNLEKFEVVFSTTLKKNNQFKN